MSNLNPKQYTDFLAERRAAVESMTSGLRSYLMAEINAEELGLANDIADNPPPSRDQLTEMLIEASNEVQAIEAQMQQISNTFSTMTPEIAELVEPYMPIINGLFRPVMEKQWKTAARNRDELHAQLMELEAEPTA